MQQVATTDYKSMWQQAVDERNMLARQVPELQGTIVYLQQRIAEMERLIYRRKSEKTVLPVESAPLQGELGLQVEATADVQIENTQKISYVRTRTTVTGKTKHAGRSKLPEDLRREIIVLEPADLDLSRCRQIGEDVTEILEVIPPEFYVKRFIRPRYVLLDKLSSEPTILTASLPGRLMEKCMAGERLLAMMLIDKYVDHLPVHRILQRFARAGITIAQSTANDWVQRSMDALTGIYALHRNMVLSCGYLHADETPIRVQDETKKGSTHTGYYWAYHSSEYKAVLFEYQPGRGRDGPDEVLKNYRGYLQTDGYQVYDRYDQRQGIVLLHCMAHARRYFFKAVDSDPERSNYMLEMFQRLYRIESRIQETGLTGNEIVNTRQEEAVPILLQMEQWMKEEYPKVLPKSPVGKAIAYCLPRWKRLMIYTQEGRLNIDNNPVENQIRVLALGRKNYLFAGSHEAAQRAAMVYSLAGTCKLLGIDPLQWLTDVFQTIHLYTSSNLNLLLPINWLNLKNQ